MKTLRLAIFVFTFFSIVLFNTIVCSAASVTNLGKFCFLFDPGSPGQFPANVQVGVLSDGSGHFVINGQIIFATGFIARGPVYGTAYIESNHIVASLTSTSIDPGPSFTFLHVVIDMPTLRGTYTVMNTIFTDTYTAQAITINGQVYTYACQ